jgi:phosphatidylglycerophosphatase A
MIKIARSMSPVVASTISPDMTAPNLRFLLAHPAHLIACGFGSGLSRLAPGTVGTLFAWLTYPALRLLYPGDANFALFLIFMAVFGAWCAHVTGRHLGEADHGAIVWDEIVPFWAVLMFVPPVLIDSPHGHYFSLRALGWQVSAFALFRLFDIVKPPPASYFDQQMKNGIGVMMDDVIAAGYAVLALAAGKALVNHLS